MSHYDDDANRMMDIYDDEDEEGLSHRPIMDEFGNLLDEEETLIVEETVEWAADEDDVPAIVGAGDDDEELGVELDDAEIGDIEAEVEEE